MREIIGKQAQENVVLASDERLVTFVDFTGLTRMQVYTEGETMDPCVSSLIKDGYTPVVSL